MLKKRFLKAGRGKKEQRRLPENINGGFKDSRGPVKILEEKIVKAHSITLWNGPFFVYREVGRH